MKGDLEWYTEQSAAKGGPTPRCPFASVFRCPRYYQSLQLMGHAGATSLDKKLDKQLLKKWKKTDFWPIVDEQYPWIAGNKERTSVFSNFCPETIYDRFGWFATSIAAHEDEIDRDSAYIRLSREKASKEDWRWYWSSMRPSHYTECPLYSLLSKETNVHSPGDIIHLRPGIFGLSVDLRTAWRKLKQFFRS